MLVSTILVPEVFVQITYLALCWLCFSTYIDAHEQSISQRITNMGGSIIFRSIVYLLLILQVVLSTLYLAGAIDATAIVAELASVELVFPICTLFLILYYQCKFSGIPQARYSEGKTRTVTTCVVIWSFMRIFQGWNGLYQSR